MTERNLLHQTLGRYQLLVAIARGGMGQVWLGRLQGARGFNKVVAIKTLLADQREDGRLESMLLEEARIASLVQHPNVVHTIELGEHEGVLFLVMEWVDGEPLGFLFNRAAERGGMPRGVAALLVGQVLAGLHAAHELHDHSGPLGVVHRDVSPHNILVTYDGVAKLLDFGVAKATCQTSSNTETGEIKGKFSYMAPEQILGGEVDRRCDIFAAGIVLYLLTTGRHPFKHSNTAAVIHSITTDEPVQPPSASLSDYPAELERVLMKALEKDADKRWASADEMREALEQAMPEAFDDGGRAELREFMERAVGDRKLARREAVRRAQLAGDARDVETGARKALQSAAQSASSLRAISISQPAPEDPEVLAGEPEERATLPAPRRRRRPMAPWIAAVAGVSLAVGVTLPRFLDRPSPGHLNGAASLPATVPATPVAASPVAASPAPAAVPVLPESVAQGAPTASASAAADPKLSRSKNAKPKAATSKRAGAPVAAPSDLLAPDYAR